MGKTSFWTLVVGSVGVVYGDIGTSPLYAFREALGPARADGILLTEEVLGTTSLILWALLLIVTIKYVVILLRMDNNGEGGILSLMHWPARRWAGRASCSCSGCSAHPCSTATPSSRRPSPCSRRWRG